MLCQVRVALFNNAKTSAVLTRFKTTEAVEISQKDNYYKNLGKFDDSKPAGWDEALPFEKIPGPKPLPVVGNVFKFALPFGEFYNLQIAEVHKKLRSYGTISVLRGMPGNKDMVFLFDPADMEMLYRNEGAWPIRDTMHSFAYYRSKIRPDVFQGVGGVLTVHGEDWFKFRSTVNPILMQPRTALQYVDNMDQIVNDFLNNIRYFVSLNEHGELPGDFINELNKWALESIGTIALDKRLGCLQRDLPKDSESQKYINSISDLFDMMYQLDILPSAWKWYSTPTWKKYIKTLNYITDTNYKHIHEALKKIESAESEKPDNESSVLQKLLKKDRKIALAMVMDMLMAGVDTTSRTLAAALYYLAKNPDAQDKLRQELRTLLSQKDSPVTKDSLAKCSYTRAALKESARLAPIATGNLRTTVKPMVLGGYQIPKGVDVITANFHISNSEEHYKDPEKYIPERWLRSNDDEFSKKNNNPFVTLPFGFGPRSCIGKRLANLELEVALMKIIRNFQLTWPHKDMRFKNTLLYGVADPLKFHLKEIQD